MVAGSGVLIHDGKGMPVVSSERMLEVKQTIPSSQPRSVLLTVTLIVLLLVPVALLLYKSSALPGAALLRDFLTLETFTAENPAAKYILFVPLGAVFIVFLRLTFGIRVLGPFRSILLAIAFQVTGILTGLFFLTLVIGVVLAANPLVQQLRLPFFGRTSAILGIVSVLLLGSVLVGQHFGLPSLTQAVYFPLVVLCLTADGFRRTLRREGGASALWRGGMTALAAVLLALLASSSSLQTILSRFPELALLQIGLILVISKYLAFRFLSGLNPVPQEMTKAVKGNERNSEDDEFLRD